MTRPDADRIGARILAWAGALGLVLAVAAPRGSAADAPAADPAATPHGEAYKLAGGPFEVDQARNLALHDAKRDKDLVVTATYPKGDGPFPTIVFSHGAGGAGDGRMPLIRFWATHGYIVLAPTHADSLAHRKPGEPRAGMAGLIRKIMNDGPGWENRAKDVSFVIDSLEEIQTKVPAIKGKVDAKRLGVGGHSYGAYTSQLIAGATVDIPGGEKARSFADPRPRAILLLSPQCRGQMGLTANSWTGITRPMMAMTGSRDFGAVGRPEGKLDSFTFAPAGDKYGVFIHDAYHMSFVGRVADLDFGAGMLGILISPGIEQTDQAAVFNDIKIATIAFWDAYLKDDAKAKAYLQSGALPSYSRGAVRLERK